LRTAITDPKKFSDDIEVEQSIRPSAFSEFIGQKSVIDNLKLYIEAAKNRKEALDHVLLFGPPGLGKTTLAYIITRELGVNIATSSGPVIERPGDLAGMLTNLSRGDVFFIDEIHRLNNVVEEYLYSAMEDFNIDIMIDKGPSARSVQLNLEHFTLIGATTRLGRLTSPLRDRFGVILRLDYYPPEALYEIILRSAAILTIDLHPDGAREIARRSRGTPRVANRILRRTRDYAQVKADGIINLEVARNSLKMLKIDENGLDSMDHKILTTIIHKFSGGPVGLNSLSVAVGEEPETIEDVYEPFLIQEGLLNRTPRGRQATAQAFQYFGLKNLAAQSNLFE
jgi:Holliday junction DNA helicase RuvB